MLNYIIADYRRILTRIPRLIFLAFYECCIILNVMIKFKNAHGNFSSVDLSGALELWVMTLGALLLGVSALVNVYSDDFKYKTMQVAIGTGVTRLQVVIAKVAQAFLILLTDILVTSAVIGVLSVVTGAFFVPAQIGRLAVEMLFILVSGTLWVSITGIVVFKLKSMLLPMVIFAAFNFNILDGLLRMLSRNGPEFIANLHLENFVPEYFLGLLRTKLLMGTLHLPAIIGIAIYLALGIYVTYLLFRRQELDF